MLPSLILKNSSLLLYATTTFLNIFIAWEGFSKKTSLKHNLIGVIFSKNFLCSRATAQGSWPKARSMRDCFFFSCFCKKNAVCKILFCENDVWRTWTNHYKRPGSRLQCPLRQSRMGQRLPPECRQCSWVHSQWQHFRSFPEYYISEMPRNIDAQHRID